MINLRSRHISAELLCGWSRQYCNDDLDRSMLSDNTNGEKILAKFELIFFRMNGMNNEYTRASNDTLYIIMFRRFAHVYKQ